MSKLCLLCDSNHVIMMAARPDDNGDLICATCIMSLHYGVMDILADPRTGVGMTLILDKHSDAWLKFVAEYDRENTPAPGKLRLIRDKD